jgi:hypothetical protein
MASFLRNPNLPSSDEILVYAEENNISIQHSITRHFSSISNNQRFKALYNWIDVLRQRHQDAPSFVQCAWNMIKADFPETADRITEKYDIYSVFINPMIKVAENNHAKKQKYEDAITKEWPGDWQNRMTAVTGLEYPARPSFQFLKRLKTFSNQTVDEHQAFYYLHDAQKARPANGRTQNILFHSDIERAQVELEKSQVGLAESAVGHLNGEPYLEHSSRKRERMASDDQHQNAASNARKAQRTDGDSASPQGVERGVLPSREENTHDPELDSTSSYQPSSDDESSNYTEYASRKTAPNPRSDTDLHITTDGEDNNALTCATCSQKAQRLLEKIKGREKGITLDDGISDILTHYQDIDWADFCSGHLRVFAAKGLGLLNNLPKHILKRRITHCMAQHISGKLNMFKAGAHSWFRKDVNPTNDGHWLEPLMWDSNPVPPFEFKRGETFRRWGGIDAWDIFQRDGTVNIPNAVPYTLRKGVRQMIEEECAMYDWHCRSICSSRSNKGWNRVAFYPLFVQACRQSMISFALTAAAREDRNANLISYPYYIKSTQPGDSTGFMHIDCNVTRFLNGEHCPSLAQSLITLLYDEDDDNCTWLTAGFQDRIRRWWRRMAERKNPKTGKSYASSGCETTAVSPAMWTAADNAEFGPYQAAPNVAGGIRISVPAILHGCPEKATRQRLGVFIWLCAVHENGELDNKESESFDQISLMHRDLAAPKSSPSGRPMKYGRIKEPFAASVKLPPCNAIADAIVGGRSWRDPLARHQRAILLGDDDDAARALVASAEERLISDWEICWEIVKQEERRRYGERSYFHCKEYGLSKPAATGDELATRIELEQ